jgi:hypothetical protein
MVDRKPPCLLVLISIVLRLVLLTTNLSVSIRVRFQLPLFESDVADVSCPHARVCHGYGHQVVRASVRHGRAAPARELDPLFFLRCCCFPTVLSHLISHARARSSLFQAS